LVLLKGLSYALNLPAKEALYLVTPSEVKSKVKGWIDIFGQRGAKALGAWITKLDMLSELDDLLFGGTLISILFTFIWMYNSYETGQQYEKKYQKMMEEMEKEK
jgi:ATP/ADP translocase